MAAIPPPPQKRASVWRHAYAGTSLALTILLCTYAGIQADRYWTIGPWGTLAGAIVGFAVGLFNFLREFSNGSSKTT